ncbi:GTPase ObgE [Blattabacterium cuenoti]|uniref:GTPase ObgE n=1 Tax=Blattabacterium cuenoti TaxID=1653831 RepID=UPI00163BEBF7|nr:GTPase ObgE [Blattabacterium cuenoti]
MKEYFVDFIKIFCKSGNGGSGCIHFCNNNYAKRKIADGGSGGKGGDIIIQGNPNINTFLHLKYNRHCIAMDGTSGKRNKITGKSGKDFLIEVPIGTIVSDSKNSILTEITDNYIKKVLFIGGKGGKGNAFFKEKNKRLYYYNNEKNGEITQGYWIFLELKILADVGIVGFPNSGKSTLLSTITNAKPIIGNYSFSNKKPYIGVVNIGFDSFLVSDIPGIIRNSSKGKGLGYRFLRHVERNKIILILISSEFKNKKKRYFHLLNELGKFNIKLLRKKQLLAISKSDLINDKIKKKVKKDFFHLGKNIVFFSSFNKSGLLELKQRLWKLLQE